MVNETGYERCEFELMTDRGIEYQTGYYNLSDGLGVFKRGWRKPIQAVGLPEGTRVYEVLVPRKLSARRPWYQTPQKTKLITIDLSTGLSTYHGGTPNLNGEDLADLNLLLSVVFAKKVTDALAAFAMSLWDRVTHMGLGAFIATIVMVLIFWGAGKL